MFQMKVVSQKTRNHFVKGGDAEKYEDCINICSFVQKIRNWVMTCDYYVQIVIHKKKLCICDYIIGWNQVIYVQIFEDIFSYKIEF